MDSGTELIQRFFFFYLLLIFMFDKKKRIDRLVICLKV